MRHLRLTATLLGALALPTPALAAASEPAKKVASAPAAKAPEEQLSHQASIVFCADELAHQLECQDDFCAAMLDLRIAQDPRFKAMASDPQQRKEMTGKCLSGIARDAAGGPDGQKLTCEKWSAAKGDLPLTQGAADAMTRCWSQGSCTDRVACWKPKFSAAMAAAMAATALGHPPAAK